MASNITIAIPNRNNGRYLSASLASIALQTERPAKVLVSDNGSTDGSLRIIAGFDDCVDEVLQPPTPLEYMEHLYWILDRVQTEYVIFLAGDDILHRNLVRKYRRHLGRSVEYAFVCSPFYYIDEDSRLLKGADWPESLREKQNDLKNVFLCGPICNISSVAWNCKYLREAPRLPSHMGNCIDWYLYLYLSARGPVGLVFQKLLYYRVHARSTGNSNIRSHTEKCRQMFIWVKQAGLIAGLNSVTFAEVVAGFDRVLQEETLEIRDFASELPRRDRLSFKVLSMMLGSAARKRLS